MEHQLPEPLDSPVPAAEPVPIYTIGYGSRSMEEFLGALHAYGIAYLIDIRSSPYSRFKPEFSKGALESTLRSHSIRYVYLGDKLGGQPNDPSCYVEGKVLYGEVAKTDYFRDGLERVVNAYKRQLRVVLMCSEGRPEQCHRSKLVGQALEAQGVPVVHIDEDGRLISQSAVVSELTGGQPSLLGPPEFTSRKRYRPEEAAHDDD